MLLHQGLGITTAAAAIDSVVPGWWQQLCQGGQELGKGSACEFATKTCLWVPGRLHRGEGYILQHTLAQAKIQLPVHSPSRCLS